MVHVSIPGGVCTTAKDLHLRVLSQIHEDVGHITTSRGIFVISTLFALTGLRLN